MKVGKCGLDPCSRQPATRGNGWRRDKLCASVDEAAVALRSLISNCSKPDAGPARIARTGLDGMGPRALDSHLQLTDEENR